MEPDGSLLLADCGNNCVRRISARPEPPTSRPQHQVYLTRGFNVFSVPPSPGVTRPILASEVARLTNSPFVVRTVARDGVSRFEAYVTSQPATDFEVPTTCAVGVVCGSGRSVDLTRRGELRPGDILTIAGTGKPGFSGDGGPAFTAQLNRPSSLALDSRGRLLVADLFNHRVRRIDLVTGQIETVAGNGRMDFSTDAASATEVPVARPGVLCVDAGDNLFIAADWQIVRADARTGALTVVAKMWDIPVQLTGTDMALPSIMVASPTGEVFFKDRITLAIYRAGPVPPNISVVTGRGMEAPTTAGIDLDASRVADVSDMTLDGPDRLRLHGIREWVADLAARKIYLLPGPRRESYEYARSLPDGTLLGVNYNESRIWRVPPAGPATLLAGDGYCQSRTADGNGRHAGDGGPAISASLSGPKAVSLDADGNLYIADASNHVIRMIVGPKGPPRLVRAR
ncbi:MAG: hypothetical protein HY814_03525 [Candidatus Riflebacteria bacterium]|nr:hypothetical protein [Candidatus Riflebacteria bacterium]